MRCGSLSSGRGRRAGLLARRGGAPQALRICRLVAGMPLGIELAASWVSMLSCAEIADEIERNVDFLATSMRDVPERHRSLRAVFDQSWRLLSDEQHAALAQLSVFRATSTASAANAVADADFRLLSELARSRSSAAPTSAASSCTSCSASTRARSWLRRLPTRRTPASGMRVTTPAMLLERQAALMGPEMTAARDELRGELDNLRAALEWILGGGRRADGAARTRSLLHVLVDAQLVRRGRDARAARANGRLRPATTRERERRRAGGGNVPDRDQRATRVRPGRGGARPPMRAVLRARNLEREVGRCLCALGIVAVYRDVFTEAVSFLEEGIELARATDDTLTEAGALMDLGFARLLMDDLDAARDAFEAANALCDALGSPILRAYGRAS